MQGTNDVEEHCLIFEWDHLKALASNFLYSEEAIEDVDREEEGLMTQLEL